MSHFNLAWFKEYKWLEYSIEKNVAYCLYCYLFKSDFGNQAGGNSFVTEGFSNWKKKERIEIHVRAHNSAHNQARQKCEALLNHTQSIITFFDKQSDQQKMLYRTRLTASVDCVHFLQQQGLAFCWSSWLILTLMEGQVDGSVVNVAIVTFTEREEQMDVKIAFLHGDFVTLRELINW